MKLEKLLRPRFIIPVTLLLLIVVVNLTKLNSWMAEIIYARGISRFWTGLFARITSIIPIAIFEVLIILLILLLVWFTVRIVISIKKKTWTRLINAFMSIVIIVLSITLIYSVTASANYYREDLRLSYYNETPVNEEYINIAQYLLDDYNFLARTLDRDDDGIIINPYTDKELVALIRREFEKLDDAYYNSYLPKAKPSIFSLFLSYNSISGMYFAPTGEAVYNNMMPDFRRPFTIAHELAHASGVMRENEANLIASYITLNSDNNFIRYSGYQATFGYITQSLYFMMNEENYKVFMAQYDPIISQDHSYYYDFWRSYDSIFDKISSYVNNVYLRLQGQKDGTHSYTGSYSPSIIDSGEVGEEGEIIFEIVFSPLQRIYFDIYYN